MRWTRATGTRSCLLTHPSSGERGRGDRAVPGDTQRARVEGARGETAYAVSLFLRTNVCGDVLAESIVFSPTRLADKRPPRPASCQSPPPKAVPALGIHPASGTTSFFILKLRPMGHNASSILDYRGQFHVRKLKTQAIRSTPKIQFSSSDFHQQRCSGYVFGPALTVRCARLASTESKGLTRKAAFLALSEPQAYPCHSSW